MMQMEEIIETSLRSLGMPVEPIWVKRVAIQAAKREAKQDLIDYLERRITTYGMTKDQARLEMMERQRDKLNKAIPALRRTLRAKRKDYLVLSQPAR